MSTPTSFVRPEATTWSVDDILRRAREGLLYIPDFQRSFRWSADDIRKLFDSIYRGYPIGNLLIWETDQTAGATTSLGPVDLPPAGGRGFVIIDGQQRITSLVAVLLGGGAKDQKFRLYFDLRRESFVHARVKEGASEALLPLPEVADTVRFLEWLQSRKLPAELVIAANQLVRALRDYKVPVYIVHTQDESQVRGIFERMNTTGKPLKAEEVFDALQRGQGGMSLRSLAQRLKGLGFGAIEEDWLLKAVAALLDIDVTRNLGEALRRIPADRVQKGLRYTEESIRKVISFLREDAGIPHIELLPYRFPLIPLTKFFHLIPEPSASTRRKLVAWVWRGAWFRYHVRSDAPTLRSALEIVNQDEQSASLHLLESTPIHALSFKMTSILERHDFRSADTKLICAHLASLKPRHLKTGAEIDVSELLDELGAKAFRRIISGVDGRLASGTVNRLIQEPFEGSIREALIEASLEVLESHCITVEARDALAQGRENEFLSLRSSAFWDKQMSVFYPRCLIVEEGEGV